MKKELLDSFLFIDFYDRTILIETEETFKLLGIDKINRVPDLIQKEALVSYLEIDKGMRIDGAIRVSGGNSHDATFDKEVVIVDSGGLWKDELDKYRDMGGSSYSTKPVVKDVEKFNEEAKKEWCQYYDLGCCGEAERKLYCSSKMYGDKYICIFERVWGSPIDFRNKDLNLIREFLSLKIKKKV